MREEPVGSSAPSRIPVQWEPSAATLEVTQKRWPELVGDRLRMELDRLRNYWTADGTAKARKYDWNAAWLFWVSNAPLANKAGPPTPSAAEMVRLDRILDSELFAACEAVQGKRAPADQWCFLREVCDEAKRQLMSGKNAQDRLSS